MNTDRDLSPRKAAVAAGTAILLMTAAAVLATNLTLNRLIVPNDPASTTGSIQAHEQLFRTGIFSWVILLICDLATAWGLYIFLKPVNRGLSLLMAWFRLCCMRPFWVPLSPVWPMPCCW